MKKTRFSAERLVGVPQPAEQGVPAACHRELGQPFHHTYLGQVASKDERRTVSWSANGGSRVTLGTWLRTREREVAL